MVFYFESTAVSPPVMLYMGRDKHENEELIRWGFPEDVWFHTDKLSSAHIYLRLPEGMTIDTIPEALLIDCCQLTKANSISGCKQNNVPIVYTMWSNLKKNGGMDIGQVGFHNDQAVKRRTVEKKVNEIINRLNKTKEEKEDVNFCALREARDAEDRKKLRIQQQEEKALKKEREVQNMKEKELKSYSTLMVEDNMCSNIDNPIDEDDFM